MQPSLRFEIFSDTNGSVRRQYHSIEFWFWYLWDASWGTRSAYVICALLTRNEENPSSANLKDLSKVCRRTFPFISGQSCKIRVWNDCRKKHVFLYAPLKYTFSHLLTRKQNKLKCDSLQWASNFVVFRFIEVILFQVIESCLFAMEYNIKMFAHWKCVCALYNNHILVDDGDLNLVSVDKKVVRTYLYSILYDFALHFTGTKTDSMHKRERIESTAVIVESFIEWNEFFLFSKAKSQSEKGENHPNSLTKLEGM